jgi:hypothetical protein
MAEMFNPLEISIIKLPTKLTKEKEREKVAIY